MDPDPLVRGTDPGIRIRIRTKMSRIPNTGFRLRSVPVPGIPVPEEHGAVLTPGDDVAVGGDVALRPRQRTGHESDS